MTRKFNLLKKNYIFLIFILFTNFFLYSEDNRWILAFDKFSLKSGISSNASVSEAVGKTLSEQIPMMIAENFSSSQIRIISEQEKMDRALSKLKEERISLYLQLDAALKTRDGLVLKNMTDSVLKSKRAEEDKKIQAIKEKIQTNIQEQKKIIDDVEKKASFSEAKKTYTEAEKYANLFKGFFTSKESTILEEKVALYDNSGSFFFDSGDLDIKSRAFEKKISQAKINALITGQVDVMGDYMSVTCSMFVYPGSRNVCTVTEIGNVSDSDFVAKSIASSFVPYIYSSLPVVLNIVAEPEQVSENLTFSIDDVVYKSESLSKNITINSGVHNLRFESPGYRTMVTSYYFDGNGTYNVYVRLKEITDVKINMIIPASFAASFSDSSGSIYANGNLQKMSEDNSHAVLKINEKEVLGYFIGNGNNAFYYIPEKLIYNNSQVSVSPKLYDKSEYIDTRRKWMYTSYSVFLISLLSSVFTYGNYITTTNGVILSGNASSSLYKESQTWKTASLISGGVTVVFGGFFTYELVRYLQTADSVLPVSAKAVKKDKD